MDGFRSTPEESRNGENQNQQTVPPSISLPTGGGAIRGMGEKFTANPVTGTFSMTVPTATSPNRSGFGSQLSLSYDSGSGNGLLGFGWNLSLPAITRKTDQGLPKYQDAKESDVFWRSPSVAPKAFGTTISVCDWGIEAGIRQDTNLVSRLER